MKILGLLVKLFITLLILPENINRQLYPSTLTLLSQKVVLVANDGIHFYDQNLDNEEEGKFIPLNIITEQDNYKTTLTQFSPENDGYILILVMDIIYFFKADGTFIISSDISDLIDNEYYCLVPYKKESNYLNYIISYTNRTEKTLILHHFKFDINTKINQQENKKVFNAFVQETNDKADDIAGGTCIILLDSSNNDLLTCFYSIKFPVEIQSHSFDPNDNFKEITNKIAYYSTGSEFETTPRYIFGITNLDKQKALIYVVNNGFSYWQTFDFNNGFSSLSKNAMNQIIIQYPNHKMFYFRQNHEFVLVSQGSSCKVYITVFNNDFTLKKVTDIIPQSNCYDSYFSTIFYNGNYYFIVNDSKNPQDDKFMINSMDLGNITNYEGPIEITNIIENSQSLENDPITSYDIINQSTETQSIIPTTELDNVETNELTNTIETNELTDTVETNELTDNVQTNELTDTAQTNELTDNVQTNELTDTAQTNELSDNVQTNELTDSVQTNELTDNIQTNELADTVQTNELTVTPNDENIKLINNNKCKTITPESLEYNLCIECNTEYNYYPALKPNDNYFHGFTECYNDNTKPINFYLDAIEKKYKPCYETCLTCNIGGNEYINNCILCANFYIKKPETPGTAGCVTKCEFAYYYTSYGQYKCVNNTNCPEEANLYIKELGKCTDNCRKEGEYQYQYDGKCLKECPKNTIHNENNICLDENSIPCIKSESEIDLREFLTSGSVDYTAKKYSKEFNYTTNHVSHFYNNIYSIVLYKEPNCIEQLSINIPKVDFGNCYEKVQNNLNPPSNSKTIIALVEKLNNNEKSTISYSFYHPDTGDKINAETICKDDNVIIKENVLSQLNESEVDLNSALFLANQNIDIFNLSNEFYSDICYHFESPNGKDVPVKERIHIFYPNITLCDAGCSSLGVNLTIMESICECEFNSILKSGIVEGNALIEGTVKEITGIISNSNLDVLFCFKDAFNIKNIAKGVGGYIIIGIFVLEITFSLQFFLYNINILIRYLYTLTENYIIFLNNKNIKNKENNKNNFGKLMKDVKSPTKKKLKSHKNLRKFNKKADNYHRSTISLKNETTSRKMKSVHQIETKNNEKLIHHRKSNKIINQQKNSTNNNENKKMEEFLKADLDDMEYDDAIKYDKRSFCEFYIDRLKQKQMILDTFYNKDDIRPLPIKIILLLLNIDLYFVINGLFFSEEYLIKLYHFETEDKFFDFIPRSIGRFFYATLVGVIVEIIIGCIFIERNRIKRTFLRDKEDLLQLRYEIANIINSIKKRYIVFTIICFIISLISWYYVSCFNNIYPGVKVEWIKSSIAIILIIQILPIFLVLFEAILRLISFVNKSERIYKLKQFIS